MNITKQALTKLQERVASEQVWGARLSVKGGGCGGYTYELSYAEMPDLTDVEIEKFKSLTEDVDFTDETSFRNKLDTLKESYFPKNKQVVTETTDDVETGNAQDIDTSDTMAVYMKAIGKGVKSAKKYK